MSKIPRSPIAIALASLGALACPLMALADTPPAASSKVPAVIEWAPFRLLDGVGEETLLKASETIQREFLDGQPGFLRRELLKGPDNQWVDLIYWASMEDAARAMEKVHQSAVCSAYLGLMVAADPQDPTGGVYHFDRLVYYESRRD